MTEASIKQAISVFEVMLKSCSDHMALASLQSQIEYLQTVNANRLTEDERARRLARVEQLREVFKGTVVDNRREWHKKKARKIQGQVAILGGAMEYAQHGAGAIALKVAARRLAGGVA